MGKVTDWIPTSKETITGTVQEAVKTNQKNGFGFLYIKCGDILQSLIFPPILKKVQNEGERDNINVNVVVLDSVARPHFYRILPRSVGVLRRIAQDPNIKATALDFELFQSVGQQTFDNMRPFFSGVIKGKRCGVSISDSGPVYIVVAGKRVSRPADLPWVSQRFIHFQAEGGERFT